MGAIVAPHFLRYLIVVTGKERGKTLVDPEEVRAHGWSPKKVLGRYPAVLNSTQSRIRNSIQGGELCLTISFRGGTPRKV
jgi:hypothetical protein